MGTAQERLCPPYEVALAVVFDGSAALCIISLGMVGTLCFAHPTLQAIGYTQQPKQNALGETADEPS